MALELAVVGLVVAVVLWGCYGSMLFQARYPLAYDGDALSHAMLVKSVIDDGWFPWRSSSLGAPFGTVFLDYPSSDGLSILTMKVIAWFGSDWVSVLNRFYLLTFFSVAWVSYAVLRSFSIDRLWCLLGAVLFSCAPYHFLRVEHLLLASYLSVPLAIWLAARVFQSRGPAKLSTISALATVPIGLSIVATGSAGIYYAFFACFGILLAGLAAATSSRSARPLLAGGTLIAAISIVAFLNVLPSIVYKMRAGPNVEVAQRKAGESEMNGLKLTHLLLPRLGHRLEKARAISMNYRGETPLNNENQIAALGLIGSVGFAVLLALSLLYAAAPVLRRETWSYLATMNLSFFLLGTIGGVGSIFAWLVSGQIRAYNRVSIFIAFVSLTAIMLLLQRAAARWSRPSRAFSLPVLGIAIGVAAVGILDQTGTYDFHPDLTEFNSDRRFVAQIEHSLPAGAMVYQLPYHPYPEAGPQEQLTDYGLFRGYLHSRHLRWSYGTMRGREGDQWFRTLSKEPLDAQLRIAAKSGFEGVYVDRRGYADRANALLAQLEAALAVKPFISDDGHLAFFRMHATGTQLVRTDAFTRAFQDPIRLSESSLPSYVYDIQGMAGPEGWGRWTVGKLASLVFIQPLPRSFTLTLSVRLAMPANLGQPIRVRAGNDEQSFVLTRQDQDITLSFTPGKADANSIQIFIPAPTSPRAIGMNEKDERPLGIGLGSISIQARGP